MRCAWSANAMDCPGRARWKPVGWRCRRFVRYRHDCAIGTMGRARWRYGTMATALCPRRRTRSRRTNTSWSMPTTRPTFAQRTRRPERWAPRTGSAMPPRRAPTAAISSAAVGGTSIASLPSGPTATASSNGAARWRARSAWSTVRLTPVSRWARLQQWEWELGRGARVFDFWGYSLGIVMNTFESFPFRVINNSLKHTMFCCSPHLSIN